MLGDRWRKCHIFFRPQESVAMEILFFFFENVSNLMDGAYVIEVKQYHQEFTLNILERNF